MEGQTYNVSQVNSYIFEFPGIGKRYLQKRVVFEKIEYSVGAYNMALGTILEDGTVNFSDSTNNGDVVKALSTAVNCVQAFANEFPDRVIFSEVIQSKKQGYTMRF